MDKWLVLLGVQLVLILALGTKIAMMTQTHHDTYQTLRALQEDMRILEIERSRLLIEQQAFSATPNVVKKAVSELGMHHPLEHERLIIAPLETD